MRLTRGEGWWLMRRREALTQAAMAEALAISEDRLRAWEKDRAASPMPSRCGRMREPLTSGELIALERRRRGWTLPEAARRLRVSRVTLWKAERDRTAGVRALRRSYAILGPARPTTAAPLQVPVEPIG